MSPQLSPDQLARLQALGINVPSSNPQLPSSPSSAIDQIASKSLPTISKPTPSLGKIKNQSQPSTQPVSLLTHLESPQPKANFAILPLLSISGLTLVSLGGLILLKAKNSSSSPSSEIPQTNLPAVAPSVGGPTQVPKSIQHYLLTSQQYFTQAVGAQRNAPSSSQSVLIDLLNQSITLATDAITQFPQDYRGYQQRGRIYQSLITSKPELASQAITDLSTAFRLQPSADLAHDLAALYARQGNAAKTINYLTQAVTIDPTKAQNFYDLAKLEEQAGLIPQAINTYGQLLTLISDPTQKSQVESEKQSLENLLAQSASCRGEACPHPSPTISSSPPSDLSPIPSLAVQSPLLQASADTGLIIAAPETSSNITVDNQTDSNSLSGNATLASGQASATISNSQVTSTSQVYLSLVSGGKNQTLKILSKTQGSFIAGFDTPLPEEVKFKWWIINN